jgi:hypothetical protein
MDVRGAVQTRPDGDVEGTVEDRAEVLRGQAFGNDQREGTDVGLGLPSTGEVPTFGGLGPVDDFLKEFDLVLASNLDPSIGHPRQARREAGDAQDVGRSAFEEVGQLLGLGFARRVAAGAAFTPGVGVGARSDIQSAGAGRAEQGLVTGKSEEVNGCRLQVDRHQARRLGGINQEQRPRRPDDCGDCLDRLDCPQYV